MYNVVLDLTPEQKQQLRVVVAQSGKTVRMFITELVVRELGKAAESMKQKKQKNINPRK